MPATTDRLLSSNEVAEYLGVPLSTLYQWRYVGRGPKGHKVGKHIRFRASEVERWLDAQGDPRRLA